MGEDSAQIPTPILANPRADLCNGVEEQHGRIRLSLHITRREEVPGRRPVPQMPQRRGDPGGKF